MSTNKFVGIAYWSVTTGVADWLAKALDVLMPVEKAGLAENEIATGFLNIGDVFAHDHFIDARQACCRDGLDNRAGIFLFQGCKHSRLFQSITGRKSGTGKKGGGQDGSDQSRRLHNSVLLIEGFG